MLSFIDSDVIQVRSIKGIQLRLTVKAAVLVLSKNDELCIKKKCYNNKCVR